MCGSGRWLRTRGVKQSQSASRVASAAPASRVESKRQPSLKRIQNHPRAHSIRTSRSVPNLGIAARPIRAIRSARASSSVLLRLAGERIPPSRARRRPVASSPVSIPRAHLGQQPILRQQLRDIRRQHHVSAVARARAVVSSVSQRSFRRVSFRSFPASPVVVVARRARRRTCTRTRRRSTFRCTESAASLARAAFDRAGRCAASWARQLALNFPPSSSLPGVRHGRRRRVVVPGFVAANEAPPRDRRRRHSPARRWRRRRRRGRARRGARPGRRRSRASRSSPRARRARARRRDDRSRSRCGDARRPRRDGDCRPEARTRSRFGRTARAWAMGTAPGHEFSLTVTLPGAQAFDLVVDTGSPLTLFALRRVRRGGVRVSRASILRLAVVERFSGVECVDERRGRRVLRRDAGRTQRERRRRVLLRARVPGRGARRRVHGRRRGQRRG